MNRFFLACCFYSFFLLPLHSQIPSLTAADRQRLASLTPRQQCDSLNEWAFLAPDPSASIPYAQEALNLSSKISYPKGISDAYMRLGQAADHKGELDSAATFYDKCLQIRKTLPDTMAIVSCYYHAALLERKRGNHEAAVKHFQEALAFFKGRPPHIYKAMIHNGLAMAYRAIGRYGDATREFDNSAQVYTILKKSPDANQDDIAIEIASLRMNRAIVMQEDLDQYRAAYDSLQKSLNEFSQYKKQDLIAKCFQLLGNNFYYQGQGELAINSYNQALATGDVLDQATRALVRKSRGRVYVYLRDYEKAYTDFHTALDTFMFMGNKGESAATYNEIGNLYYEKGEYENAVKAYKQALELKPQNLGLQGNLLYYLPNALDETGNKEEAAQYTQQYLDFLGSLNPIQAISALNQLKKLYVIKNRAENGIYFKEKQTQRTNTFLGLLGMCLLVALLIFINTSIGQKKRIAEKNAQIAEGETQLAKKNAQIAEDKAQLADKNAQIAETETQLAKKNAQIAENKAQLAEKNAQIAENKAHLAEKNAQLAIQEKLEVLRNLELEQISAAMKSKEETEQRIGKELHDGLGAVLSTVRLLYGSLDERISVVEVESRKQYDTANRLLDEACEDVRRLSHELSNALLLKFGLDEQLKAMADTLRTSGELDVELVTFGLVEPNRLNNNMGVSIYRMIQILTHNVIKHADAHKLVISVNHFGDLLNIMVEDDGKGFDMDEVNLKDGIGIKNLQARVHDFGGQLQIDSKPTKGTRVSIDLPIPSDDHSFALNN